MFPRKQEKLMFVIGIINLMSLVGTRPSRTVEELLQASGYTSDTSNAEKLHDF